MGLSSSKQALGVSASITETDRVILSLKTQRNKLNEQQRLLESRMDKQQEAAKMLLREGKKERALLALKKKKLTEQQHSQLLTHVLNIEGMLGNIETIKQQGRVTELLQRGNEALKRLQQEVSIDDVRRLMDETAEAKAYQDELSELMSQSMSSVDEDAVAAELEVLEDERIQQEVEGMPQVPKERVPSSRIPTAVQLQRGEGREPQQEATEARGKLEPMMAS